MIVLLIAAILLVFSQLDIRDALPATYAKPIPIVYTGNVQKYTPHLIDLPKGYRLEEDILPESVGSRLTPYQKYVSFTGFEREQGNQSGLPNKIIYGVFVLAGSFSTLDMAGFTRYDNLIQEGMELIKPPTDTVLTWDSETLTVHDSRCTSLTSQEIYSDSDDGNLYLYANCQMDNLVIMMWIRVNKEDLHGRTTDKFLADQVNAYLGVVVTKAWMIREGIVESFSEPFALKPTNQDIFF